MLPALLRQPGARARRRRDDPRRAAGCVLSLSHEILREYREYERMSTTVVNAYIGPKVGGYVRTLQSQLARYRVQWRSCDHAVERRRDDARGRDRAAGDDDGIGPGRRHHRLGRVGKALGYTNVVSFDMGGTTAKASLVRDGEPTFAPRATTSAAMPAAIR